MGEYQRVQVSGCGRAQHTLAEIEFLFSERRRTHRRCLRNIRVNLHQEVRNWNSAEVTHVHRDCWR